jgi:RNA polymerase sigma factor (TIGR02999 family)
MLPPHPPEGEPTLAITELLTAWRLGDAGAMERLMPLVYDDLQRRAHQHLRRVPDATLGTTGLVHEAYLKLVGSAKTNWQDRNHFFAIASKAMRSVLVDYARKRFTKKRGAMAQRVELDDALLRVEDNAADILAIHEALDRLAGIDGRLSDVVELRFFGGLSFEEVAQMWSVSEVTVKRSWSKARTVLYQLLHQPAP